MPEDTTIDGRRRIVRVTTYPQISFDLSVPRDADEEAIDRLIALHTREMGDWFDSLSKPLVLGEGNMALEDSGLFDWE